MMMREAVSTIFIMFVVMVIGLATADYFTEKYGGDLVKDDGVLEELAESIIDDKIGINVDLTPDSLETK